MDSPDAGSIFSGIFYLLRESQVRDVGFLMNWKRVWEDVLPASSVAEQPLDLPNGKRF
jgi:hypothetical protein